jgi:hypothetical protein
MEKRTRFPQRASDERKNGEKRIQMINGFLCLPCAASAKLAGGGARNQNMKKGAGQEPTTTGTDYSCEWNAHQR